jgi:hypothetical protein
MQRSLMQSNRQRQPERLEDNKNAVNGKLWDTCGMWGSWDCPGGVVQGAAALSRYTGDRSTPIFQARTYLNNDSLRTT